ncbi:MAG: radical SAM family heme chaperone HemW [Hyphomonadaceae bacterium]
MNAGLGLYIHWPYCARVCPYCDFNVYRQRGRDTAPLLQAIADDLRAHAALMGRRRLDTIFFGGGTPSLLAPQVVAALIETAAHCFTLAPDAEISLEANPEDRAQFAALIAAGINRLSIGAQALDDAALRALGRNHDAAGAIAAIEAAARTGARVSADFIYARGGQDVASWREELARIVRLPVEHLSLYELTVAEGTAFARAAARGRLAAPDDALAADFYLATQGMCEAAGFPAYEVSNHARRTEAQARHNLIYWRCGEWLGLGPGAHGRIVRDGVRVATKAFDAVDAYAAAVAAQGTGWESETPVTAEAEAEEAVIMGLRVVEGFDRAAVERARAAPLNESLLADLAREGLLVQRGGRVALTARGRLLADRIAQMLA